MIKRIKHFFYLKKYLKELKAAINSTSKALKEHEDDDDINAYRNILDVYYKLVREHENVQDRIKNFEWI